MSDERWSGDLEDVHDLVRWDAVKGEKPLSPTESKRLTSIKWCLLAVIMFYLLVVVIVGGQLIQAKQEVVVDDVVLTVLI